MNEVKQSVSTRNNTLDAGRLICAFLVVLLHTRFPVPYVGAYLVDIAKIAVPYFLILSGYYLYSEQPHVIYARAKNSALKLAVIVIVAAVLYGTLRLIKSRYLHIDISNQNFNLLPFLLFNDFNFTEHLWYCFAYLYVLLILMLISKYGQMRSIFYLIPFLFSVHFTFTLWSRFVSIEDGKFWYELNWLVIELPFVSIGMLIRKYWLHFNLINKKWLLILIAVLLVSIFLEHFAFKQFAGRGPGVFAISFLAIAVYIYCAQDNNILFNERVDAYIASWGKEHSLNIYIYHIMIRELFAIANMTFVVNNTIGIFLVTLACSIGFNRLKSVFQPLENQ